MSPYQETLGEGLTLRTLRDETDASKFTHFNAMVNGAAEGLTCECLLHHHPDLNYDDYVLVVNDQDDEVVSTTCLIPWRCRFEGIDLKVAMLEMVVTHPQYRHRGLIRRQIDHYYHPRVQGQGYDLSVIFGIPYYYRQFSYAYAIDLGGYDSLPAWQIPDIPSGEAPSYSFRAAGVDDLPVLVDLYQAEISRLDFYTVRDIRYWRYLLEGAHLPVKIIEHHPNKKPAGYIICRCPSDLTQEQPPEGVPGEGRSDQRRIEVLESSIPNQDAAFQTLRMLKDQSSGEIRLAWPETSTLVRIARSLGSLAFPVYQCLLRITDIAQFLMKLAPVLEKRLASSDCAGISTDLLINLYRQAFCLRLQDGRLESIEPVGFVDASMGADGGDLCIPPEAFTRLVVGFRSPDELRDAWPDLMIRPGRRHLLDVLFPKRQAYFCMPYNFHGQ